MIGPIPFLERLAPSARERYGVRAALAPRFAPDAIAADSETPPAEGLALRAAPAGDDGGAAHRPRMDGLRDIVAAPADPHPSEPAQPSMTQAAMPLASVDRSRAESAPHGSPHRAAPAEATVARIEHRQRVIHEAISAMPTRVNQPSKAPQALRNAPPLTPITRTPLRLSTIEQRLPAAQRPAPMVVEVTIDRIDVRASPAAAPARPNAKPRGHASAQPLADYLRQRDRARNGGAA